MIFPTLKAITLAAVFVTSFSAMPTTVIAQDLPTLLNDDPFPRCLARMVTIGESNGLSKRLRLRRAKRRAEAKWHFEVDNHPASSRFVYRLSGRASMTCSAVPNVRRKTRCQYIAQACRR
ncbi:MAG: hypothetical protein AB8B94_10365 [Hyphomicrobiales bacterium]